MNYLDFTQMLCSRLCHDLITPAGAINTGMELLEGAPDSTKTELLQVCRQSAATVVRRLVYYRMAFGYSSINHIEDLEELGKAVRDFLEPANIQVHWKTRDSDPWFLEPVIDFLVFARMFLNLVLVASETAPFGGEFSIHIDCVDNCLLLDFKITGKLVEMRPEIRKALTGEYGEAHQSPRTIQAIMARMLVEEADAIIDELESSKTAFSLQVRKHAANSAATLPF